MTYYKDLQRAYSWIDKQTNEAIKQDKKLDAKQLAYEATKRFPVGEKKLLDRMEKMALYDDAPIRV